MFGTAILQPMLAMMGITAIVWLRMYWIRINLARSGSFDHSKLESDPVNLPAEFNDGTAANFRNLFEAPVLFYIVCILMLISANVGNTGLWLAWAFVALRGVHSFIHCTYNAVMHRFYAYAASSIVLGVMMVRLALEVI